MIAVSWVRRGGLSFSGAHTNVPSLCDKDADEEEDEGDASTDPAVQHIRRGLVKERLILLLDVSDRFR